MTPDRRRSLLADPKLPKFDGGKLREILGDLTPVLEPSARGRIRLIRALEARFGGNFRSYDLADRALKDFDDQVGLIRDYLRLKGVQGG